MKPIGNWGLISGIFILLLALCGAAKPEPAGWPATITIGTASPGGPYYVYGQEIAHVLSRTLGIEINAQVTQGPAQNIVLMERREALLGFITTGVGLQAWNGTDWAKGTQYRSMRVMFPMYDTAFQLVAAKRLRINWLEDLAGLRVGAGPRAGTGGGYVPAIFKGLDVTADIRFGAQEQIMAQMASGEIDAVVVATGFPMPALAMLDAVKPLDFIQPTSDEIVNIRKQMPEITPSVIPAGTYQSLAQDYHTVGLYNFAVAHKDLPDELVYRIVKAVFENHEELVKAQSSAKETIPANISLNTMLPLHPGAIRYYREMGIDIPQGALVGK